MNGIYKIETYSDSAVNDITRFISRKGGRYVVQGWAIITDYSFNSPESLSLLSYISGISDNISDADIYTWSNATRLAA